MKIRRSRNEPAAPAQGAAAAPQPNDGAVASSEPRADILRALVDNLDEAVVVLGRDGRVQFANAAAERLYGIQLEGAPISGWSEAYGIYLPDRQTLWPADELPGAVALHGQTVEGEQYVCPPGASAGYWIEVRARPIFDAQRGSARARCWRGAIFPRKSARRRASDGCWRSSRTRRIW